MSKFVIYDTTRDKDLREHDRLFDAYRDIDQMNGPQGIPRYAVRLAREHRANHQRASEPPVRGLSFLVS